MSSQSMQTMKEWFGLTDGHEDFSIETDADAELFFARAKLDKELQSILRKAFRTNSPPKMVLYGDWGVGKTHTMRHMEFSIENKEKFDATVVFVEMPDVTAKSTFQVVHAALLDALGVENAKRWTTQFQADNPNDALQQIQDFTQSGDIATAFGNLLAMGEGARIAWDWLRGLALSASDARLAGLPPSLSQSGQYVRVLQMLGRLSQQVDQKMLVFMVDEATKLGYVTNADSVNHWINALKLLSDPGNKEVGLIISGSWIDPDDSPLPLQDEQVAGRFGEAHYLRLHNLDENDAAEFMSDLLEQWVDPEVRENRISSHSAEADGEKIDATSYPFTRPGFELAVRYACRQGGFTTPREIQQTVDDLLNRAIDDGRHLASGVYINELVAG